MSRIGTILTGMIALILVAPASAESFEVDSWDFDVFLNDKRVGKHEFRVSQSQDVKLVESEASFDYKFLFITAYRYQHSAAERWSGNCLAAFDASTNANGDQTNVSGERSGAGFLVEKNGTPVELPECVMTFAYWNPDFLDQPRLLNPQTGEYVDVLVESEGDDTLEVRGQFVTAKRFRLTAYETDLTLWYSSDNKWLALESVAKGGHIVRYTLS